MSMPHFAGGKNACRLYQEVPWWA